MAGVKCRSDRGISVYSSVRRPEGLVRRVEGNEDVDGEGINSPRSCLAVNLVSLWNVTLNEGDSAIKGPHCALNDVQRGEQHELRFFALRDADNVRLEHLDNLFSVLYRAQNMVPGAQFGT
jgi:hypothetical protein